MFDIGLFELVVLSLVVLLVFGPERLPEVARTLGRWVGRVKRLAAGIKQEFDREIQAEELQELAGSLSKPAEELQRDWEKAVEQGMSDVQAQTAETGASESGLPKAEDRL